MNSAETVALTGLIVGSIVGIISRVYKFNKNKK